MKTKDESIININNAQRAITVLAGAFMLYKALTGEKKKIIPAVTGACMVLTGITGNRTIYDALTKRGILA